MGHGDKVLPFANQQTSKELPSEEHITKRDGGPVKSFFHGVWAILASNKLNILLLAVPASIACEFTHAPHIATFVVTLLGIMPLAFVLGSATEELSKHTSQTIGGLLNATFGNATELIISITALASGMLTVVQSSVLGSILSNLLLVLGGAFAVGGMKREKQNFNASATQTSGSMMALAIFAIVVPAALVDTVVGTNQDKLLALSRGSAVLLIIVYGFYLTFQLKTHKHLFADEEGQEEEHEEPLLTKMGAIILLTFSTGIVAWMSEILVGTIEHVSEAAHLSDKFIAFVLLPIVGNAAEHFSAITFAMKDKMNLSISIAIGSSIQIALFVIPVLVLLGWMIGQPLTLFFHTFESIITTLAVLIMNFICQDGESNYMEGVLLLVCYFIIAIAFFVQ